MSKEKKYLGRITKNTKCLLKTFIESVNDLSKECRKIFPAIADSCPRWLGDWISFGQHLSFLRYSYYNLIILQEQQVFGRVVELRYCPFLSECLFCCIFTQPPAFGWAGVCYSSVESPEPPNQLTGEEGETQTPEWVACPEQCRALTAWSTFLLFPDPNYVNCCCRRIRMPFKGQEEP